MEKREFIKNTMLGGMAMAVSAPSFGMENQLHTLVLGLDNDAINANGEYTLPPLPYPYESLEPHIDRKTMQIHHDLHHAGYVKGLNNANQKIKESIKSTDYSMIKHWQKEAAFHGAGHFLHCIFWKNISPAKSSKSAQLDSYIAKSFGGFDEFKALFKATSVAVEGSGWGILAYDTLPINLWYCRPKNTKI